MDSISRAQFLKLSLAVVGAAATGTLAAACGDDVQPSQPRKDVPPVSTTDPAPPTTGDDDPDAAKPKGDGGSGCGADLKLEGDKIAQNHGHVLTIKKDELAAKENKTFNIQGTGDHPHDVTVSADQLARLRNGERVEVTSSNTNGHTHKMTLECA